MTNVSVLPICNREPVRHLRFAESCAGFDTEEELREFIGSGAVRVFIDPDEGAPPREKLYVFLRLLNGREISGYLALAEGDYARLRSALLAAGCGRLKK
jgi:hypothetical protein